MRRFIREEANKIAIFGADNWLGYVVAWAILNLYRKRKFSVRVIVRDESAVEDLRKLGAEVSTIDYDHDETIDSALTGVNTVIFAPEVDHQRIDDSKKLAESMKRVNLVNIVTLSILGAGDSKEQTLTDYREIEKAIEGTKSRWVTLRPALLSERFLHYEKRIKEKHILSLNVHSDSRWSPLNLKDLIETISVICFDNGKLRDAIEHKHVGKRYTLTGPEALTGPLIVDTINYVIGQQNIEFIEIEREEHKKYLQSLGNDEPNDTAFGKRNKNRYPPPPPPNDIEIELILDFYDYVKTGNANYVSGDFNSITHEDPQRLLYFIEENSKSFKSNPTEYRSRL